MEERNKGHNFKNFIKYFGKTDLQTQKCILVKKISLIKGAAFLQKLKSAEGFCHSYSPQKLSEEGKLCREAAWAQQFAIHIMVKPFRMRALVSTKFHSHLLVPRNNTRKI